MMQVVVLISGSGTNLQAIIDAAQATETFQVCAVISNRAEAYGLQRAAKANIPTHVISHQDFVSRTAFDQALQEKIDTYQPDLIALAGFMRRLGSEIVRHYAGKMINLHPSLLPKYPGLHTHEKALEAKDRTHGTSIHFVTEDLDAGPIIAQASLEIRPEDNEETLKTRVLTLEHTLYPTVLGWFAKGRIRLMGNQITMDDQPLNTPIQIPQNPH